MGTHLQRGVITLAYGAPSFAEQARSLALSLQLHAPHLPRTLVTDSNDASLWRLFDEVISYRPEFGSGVRQKLFIDQYSPYEETLFIDSDCLVLGRLDSFWTAFAGQTFGVQGTRYLERGASDPYMDVDHVLDALQVTRLAKFNGGTYYFARSRRTTDFFTTVRGFLDKCDSLRVRAFRGDGPNDETIYSLAMAVHGIGSTSMGQSGMWTPAGYSGPLLLDVERGTCSFLKEGTMVFPEIVHFPGGYSNAYPYIRECARLRTRSEGRATPAWTLAGQYGKSALWHCSRSLSVSSKAALRRIAG